MNHKWEDCTPPLARVMGVGRQHQHTEREREYPAETISSCLGRYILGTKEGNITNDIQDRRQIDHYYG